MHHFKIVITGVIAALSIIISNSAFAAEITYTADTNVTVGSFNLKISSGSTATSVVVGTSTIVVTTGTGESLTLTSATKEMLNGTGLTVECFSDRSQVTVPASTVVTITPSTTVCSSGGGGGGNSSTPATPASPATPAVPATPAKETQKVEEKAPVKTQEVAKELTKKLTLMDSKSKASLVLDKGTKLTVGDTEYKGSISSPGQLNPSKAVVDFGSPSATGTVVQAVQSKTTGDVVVWLSKPATLTFKITPAQKGTKYKGKARYELEAYYYNPTAKAFTKLTGKKTGANFAASNVTYIGGPFFLVETDMKPAPKAKKTK